MPVLDRYIGALDALRTQVALDGLTSIADSDKTAFGYGKAVGRLEGIALAEQALQKVLSDQEKTKRDTGRAD